MPSPSRAAERGPGALWLLALAAVVAPAHARVCDAASQKLVPCVPVAGIQMPAIALGSWRGSYKDCSADNYTCAQERAFQGIKTWVGELGAQHVDTANNYRTQVQVGEAVKAVGLKRDEVFLTTKCPGAIGYDATLQCLEDNLQMLGLYGDGGAGYVDLLLIHFPFAMKPQCNGRPSTTPGCDPPFFDPGPEVRKETWKAMEFLQKSGRARAVGVSDYQISHLEEILPTATVPVAVNQVEWHPYKHDEELKSYCEKHGIVLQAWSPLSGASASALSDPVIKDISSSHGVSPASVVLRWSLQQNVTVVVGTAVKSHMQGDLAAASVSLTEDEVRRISALKSSASRAPVREVFV